jgi:cytochrome b pre-mRNA-processing protein 3
VISRIRSPRLAAANLYTAAVEAARRPVFYRDLDVPDSIEGRYEMIVLHVVLMLRRLRAADGKQARLAQAIVDYMASDLDRSIREIGVGDMSVGKFMKRLGQGLYGRAVAYDGALDSGDMTALEKALTRNIFDGESPGERVLAVFARYVQTQLEHLDRQPIEAIAVGTIDFLSLADFEHGTQTS